MAIIMAMANPDPEITYEDAKSARDDVIVATGRSDHLGGDLTPDKFAKAKNATHDDILFAPHKTPDVRVSQVRMIRAGENVILIEDFQPAAYMRQLLES